mgnify:FL=1
MNEAIGGIIRDKSIHDSNRINEERDRERTVTADNVLDRAARNSTGRRPATTELRKDAAGALKPTAKASVAHHRALNTRITSFELAIYLGRSIRSGNCLAMAHSVGW